MHTKTSKEIIHATRYLHEKLVVSADPTIPLHFLLFLFFLAPNPKYATMLQEKLSVQDYEERE